MTIVSQIIMYSIVATITDTATSAIVLLLYITIIHYSQGNSRTMRVVKVMGLIPRTTLLW